jgi:hypothetical protein
MKSEQQTAVLFQIFSLRKSTHFEVIFPNIMDLQFWEYLNFKTPIFAGHLRSHILFLN